jgi:hypothetical protein
VQNSGTLARFFAMVNNLPAEVQGEICTAEDAAFPRVVARYVQDPETLATFFAMVKNLPPEVQGQIYTVGNAAFPKAVMWYVQNSEMLATFFAMANNLPPEVQGEICTAEDAAFPKAVAQHVQNPEVLATFFAMLNKLNPEVRKQIYTVDNADFPRRFMQHAHSDKVVKVFFEAMGELIFDVCAVGDAAFPSEAIQRMSKTAVVNFLKKIENLSPNVHARVYRNTVFMRTLFYHTDIVAQIEAPLGKGQDGKWSNALVSAIKLFREHSQRPSGNPQQVTSGEVCQSILSYKKHLSERQQGAKQDGSGSIDPIVGRILAVLQPLEQWVMETDRSPSELQRAGEMIAVARDYSMSCADALRTSMEELEVNVQLLMAGNNSASIADELATLADGWGVNEIRATIAKMSGVCKNERGGLVEFAVLVDNVWRLLRNLPDNGALYPRMGEKQAGILNAALTDDLPVAPGILFRDVVALFRQEGEYRDLLKKLKSVFPLKYNINFGDEHCVHFRNLERALIYMIWSIRTEVEKNAFLNFVTTEGVVKRFISKVGGMTLGELAAIPQLEEKARELTELVSHIGRSLSPDGGGIAQREDDQEELDRLKSKFFAEPSNVTLNDIKALYREGIDVSEILDESQCDKFGELMSDQFEVAITQDVIRYEAGPVLERFLSTYPI